VTGLHLSKAIQTILAQAGIDNAHAIVAEENTRQPFAVYRRASLSVDDTKDRLAQTQRTTLSVQVVSMDYQSGLMLADSIAEALTGKTGTFAGVVIDDIVLSDASEMYNETSYLQDLTFDVTIENE
jgi:IMP cyclohydrolase